MVLLDTSFSYQGQPETLPRWGETSDLRTRPIYKDRTYHYPYTTPRPPLKHTSGLERGTQRQLIQAARKACEDGRPITTLLTVRLQGLLTYHDLHPLRAMKEPEAIRHLVECIRKWLYRRKLPAYYLWVREISEGGNQHWHLGLHLPKSKRKAFSSYLANDLLIEPVGPPRPASKQTRGEFACSEMGNWHLAEEVPDGKPHFTGYWIAAYLGKGEPSQHLFRGKLVNNTDKPVRGREFGGKQKDGRYDEPQGNIVGTTTRKGRVDIAKSLK